MGQLFGTDGIRGLANVHPMSGEIAMEVGRAVAYVLHQHPEKCGKSSLPVGFQPLGSGHSMRRARVVVGKDTRLANYMIENAIVSGLCSMGADAIQVGPLPTPGVAFVTQSMRADAGIMISASHNPYWDTGIKIFLADGYKLPDELEQEIEALVLSKKLHENCPTKDMVGKAARIEDAIGRYIVYLKSLFSSDVDLMGMRVVVDCANGAAYKIGPIAFEELGAEVIRVGTDPNGLNINKKCGALHPSNVASKCLETRADIGVSLDGDGDRCILSDENGEIVDGDQIIGLCALQMAADGELEQSTVVTTPMSNIGLEVALKREGIRMIRAKVGDRYIVEEMKKNGYTLGGEQSGHIIFHRHSTTGDGIFAALKVLEIMRRTGKRLSELKKQIHLYPQVIENVKVSDKKDFSELPDVSEKIQKAEKELGENGRVFVRYSGTEPLARVMVEGEDQKQIDALAHDIASAIKRNLA